jgi:hypothetical protein
MEILVRVDQQTCPLNFLERMELVGRIQSAISGLDEVGSSLSTVTFGRSLDVGDAGDGIGGVAARALGFGARTKRSVLNRRLVAHRQEFLDGDYLRDATLPDGREAGLHVFRNDRGTVLKFTDYGLIVTELHTRDRNGVPGTVVLGFDNLARYLQGHPFFGCVVGRFANRIAGGRFTGWRGRDGRHEITVENRGAARDTVEGSPAPAAGD